MQFRFSQWLLEIGFGLGLLLLASTALKLAMQHTEIPQINGSSGGGGDRHAGSAFEAMNLARPIGALVEQQFLRSSLQRSLTGL